MEIEKEQPRNPLGYEKIFVLLRKFAVPSIIAMLVSSLYNIVDQIFIGQGVGYLGNAATNVAFPLTTISMAIALLIGVGSASKFSIELGRRNEKEARDCIGNALWMVVILGVIYCVLTEVFMTPMLNAFGATVTVMPYAVSYVQISAIGMPFLIFTSVMSNLIRADGSPRFSMVCMIAGAVVNIVLDPIFIFIFEMGVAGAALATVISQFVSLLIALSYLWKFKHVKLSREIFKPKLKKCTQIAALGLSNSFNQIAITLVQIVINNSLTYYGAMSVYGEDIPLSSFGIVMKVNSIFLAVFIGISQGAQPIMGYNYGAEQYRRVKETYKLAVKFSFVVSIIGFIMFQFFPQYVIAIFGSGDELYFEFAIKSMKIFLFMIIINGVQMISSNFFSAIGMPVKGIVLSLSRQVFLIVPLILILPIFWGIDGIMYSGPIADSIAFIISVMMVKHKFKNLKNYKRV